MANKRPRPQTWSLLSNVRKKPSEYEIVSSKIHYHFRRDPAPFELNPHTPINEWYLRYREHSPLQAADWEGARDPQQLTYRRYIKQQHESETYIENLIDEFERQDHDAHLDPGWVKVLERLYIPTRYPLHVLQMSSLYLGQMAPSAFLSNVAFFQASDELRALQWSAYRAKSLSLAHYPELASSEATRQIWETDPVWQPLRETLEKLLLAYDWGETFAALNLVIKPLFDQLYVFELTNLARTNGDALSALMLANFARDSEYSRAWTRALWQYAIQQRPENQAQLETWVEKWLPPAQQAVNELAVLFSTAPQPVAQAETSKRLDEAYQAFRSSWSS